MGRDPDVQETDVSAWPLHELQSNYSKLLHKYRLGLAAIESLKRHEKDTTQMVRWLHCNTPERFDLTGRQTMGDIAVGIFEDYLALRRHAHGSPWERLRFVLFGK
jgi:hypothetical protein